MLHINQAREIAALQDQINRKINPHWVSEGYAWLRALAVETGEAMDHGGFKWWKHGRANVEQVQLELVDIWHFAVSHLLQVAGGSANDAAIQMTNSHEPPLFMLGKEIKFDRMKPLERLDLMMGLACFGRFSVSLFDAILTDWGMSWSDIYRQYIAKNVLNTFRQDHGYKDGTYRKVWAGREDNEHLVELFAEMAGDNLRQRLYDALKQRYRDTEDAAPVHEPA